MATRVLLLRKTGVGTSFTQIPTIDGADTSSPPTGLKWTITEIRVGMSAAGEWKIQFDTEKYYNGRQELDFLAKAVPHVVALDVQQPHEFELDAKADSGTTDVNAEIQLEESSVGGAAP